MQNSQINLFESAIQTVEQPQIVQPVQRNYLAEFYKNKFTVNYRDSLDFKTESFEKISKLKESILKQKQLIDKYSYELSDALSKRYGPDFEKKKDVKLPNMPAVLERICLISKTAKSLRRLLKEIQFINVQR